MAMAMAMCLSLLQTTAFAVEAEAESVGEDVVTESAEVEEDLNEATVNNHTHTYSIDNWYFTSTGEKTLDYDYAKASALKVGYYIPSSSTGNPSTTQDTRSITYECTECGKAAYASATVKSVEVVAATNDTPGSVTYTVTADLKVIEDSTSKQTLNDTQTVSSKEETSGTCGHNTWVSFSTAVPVIDVDNVRTTIMKVNGVDYTVLADASGAVATANTAALVEHQKLGHYTQVKYCATCGKSYKVGARKTIQAQGHEWEVRYDTAKTYFSANNSGWDNTNKKVTYTSNGLADNAAANNAVRYANNSAQYACIGLKNTDAAQ